jgi:hypothetical protein
LKEEVIYLRIILKWIKEAKIVFFSLSLAQQPKNDTSQSIGLLWRRDRSVAQTIHNTHKKQTSMLPAEFEPTVPQN